MKIQVHENRTCFFFSFFVVCFFLLIQNSQQQRPQNTTCPFKYIYSFGDGITDIGNTVRVLPFGPFLPAARSPYGQTFPGQPTGRWSDGRIAIDYIGSDLGLPNIVPYLSLRGSTSNDGVIFSAARSTTLDRLFFKLRGVAIPPYAIPLSGQLRWFKAYLSSLCSTPQDCANIVGDSVIILGDIEANDIGYALEQGKSIQQVETYVPFIIRALIEAATELIRMGATRVVLTGSVPVGCYPYILTALQTNNATAYDDLGCLKSVNDLILSKNQLLQEAVTNLAAQFPNVGVYYAGIYDSVQSIIRQSSISGNMTLKSCCGIGGQYNYDRRRFCGSRGVLVCANPSEYIYWDGLHFTQDLYAQYTNIVVPPFLPVLGCTSN
ncbi:hypothetical protein ABFS82_07G108800 [Erythranthe guttata]|uniref:Uncharacterized protein n=1 Tax=Erythranthe guttata TaxID=4155 RepID=A0A022R0M0_ERYGU|nr:hypothetical protein MIMGU_mgv1a008288mg [Erythranthe guttata]